MRSRSYNRARKQWLKAIETLEPIKWLKNSKLTISKLMFVAARPSNKALIDLTNRRHRVVGKISVTSGFREALGTTVGSCRRSSSSFERNQISLIAKRIANLTSSR